MSGGRRRGCRNGGRREDLRVRGRILPDGGSCGEDVRRRRRGGFARAAGRAFACAAAVLVALCAGAGLLPAVRQGAVRLAEARLMHRGLNMAYWTQQLLALAFIVLALDVLLCLAAMTLRGRALCRSLAGEIASHAREVWDDRRSVLVLFSVSAFGMLSVFRANYYYGGADDLYRAMSGARAWRNFYRYVSHFLSVAVHTSPRLADIAPLTQLLALLVMAVSAAILVRLFAPRRRDGALPYSPLVHLAAVPVSLFPYFLENLSYRYDAPYMALSVFFCIVPFLFSGNVRSFALMSAVCLFLMCLSYQAASGVYIVVCAFCVFRMWARREKSASGLASFILAAVLCYALTLALFFVLFNVQPAGESYVDKSVHAGVFLANARAYLSQVWEDFGWSALKLASLLLLPLFVALACRNSRRGALPTALVALLLLAFCAPFSYGAFLVMGRPLLEPRSMFPFGMVVGLPAICVAGWLSRRGGGGRLRRGRRRARGGPLSVLAGAAVAVLSYSVVVYAFAYGNAQGSQKKYTDFRMTILLQDLSRVVPEGQDDIHVHVLSDIDHTLIVRNLARTYPLTTRMLEALGGHAVVFYLQDFGFGVQAETDRYSSWDKDLGGYLLVADSRYHSVYANGNVYYVYFKSPGITLRE